MWALRIYVGYIHTIHHIWSSFTQSMNAMVNLNRKQIFRSCYTFKSIFPISVCTLGAWGCSGACVCRHLQVGVVDSDCVYVNTVLYIILYITEPILSLMQRVGWHSMLYCNNNMWYVYVCAFVHVWYVLCMHTCVYVCVCMWVALIFMN